MERVLRQAEAMGTQGERGALCTIVETRGSVPAPVGSRMLVRADGTFAGTVGGGCLEHDVWGAARRVLDDGRARCIPIDLTDYEAQEAGLACGGSLRVLIEPVSARLAAAIAEAREAAARGGAVALWHRLPDGDAATPASGRVFPAGGDEPPPAGEHLGPALVAAAADVCAAAEPRTVTLTAGGEAARVFLQPLNAPQLVILGAGHVGKAIDAAVRPCGWQTIVVDDRADFASAERFPESRCIVAPFADAFAGIPVHPSTAVLVVTRGHRYDAEALGAALATGAGYVGLIGSARKILTVYERLLEQGVAPERLAQVFAPIGSAIGAETPAEIAAAVAAELVAVRRLGADAALALNPKAARVRESFGALLAKRASS